MNHVAIVGTGLIGASFGLALRAAGFHGRITGVSSPPAVRDALAAGAIDDSAPLEEAARIADLIYLAQPISRILTTIRALGPLVRPEALVTDAGSTKARICTEARAHLRPGQFLGGHPMAGKESRGASEADGMLFDSRTYVLTPNGPGDDRIAVFQSWVGKIGAVAVEMSPEEHDRIVALTSHLPQLLSTTLAGQLQPLGTRAALISGPGLIDMTRLARSAWEIWKDILETNAGPVAAALDAYIARLQALRAALPKLEADFASGERFSTLLRNSTRRGA